MSTTCPECGAVAARVHEIDHSVGCPLNVAIQRSPEETGRRLFDSERMENALVKIGVAAKVAIENKRFALDPNRIIGLVACGFGISPDALLKERLTSSCSRSSRQGKNDVTN